MTEGMIAQDNLIGTTLDDRFSVVSLISRGGLSVLYRGVDKSTSNPVTVRVLINEKQEHDVNKARFTSAMTLMESLRHPNIVALLGSGTTPDGAPYLVLPFVDGRSVRDKVEKDGPLSFAEALPIIADVGAALEYAHQHGIVHRNLKPSNIMLQQIDGKQRAVVTGFGIAKKIPTGSGESISRTSKVVGSPLYMSPEQFLNSKVDARSDIYSLGCVIHQMLCGKPPFEAPSLVQLMGAHHHRYREHFAPELNVPAFVDDVLDAATMKLPANRYASVLNLVEDLQKGKCSIDLSAARKLEPAAEEQMVQRQQTIKTAAVFTAGSVLIVALIIFIVAFDSLSKAPKPASPPPVASSASSAAELNKLIDNGSYPEAIAVLTNQLSFAEAAGERTEVLRERLALLDMLTNKIFDARKQLERAIVARANLMVSEPDTKEMQKKIMSNDYALIALTMIETEPEDARAIAESHMERNLETVPERMVVERLAQYYLNKGQSDTAVHLRELFNHEIIRGNVADQGVLTEYLINAATKE